MNRVRLILVSALPLAKVFKRCFALNERYLIDDYFNRLKVDQKLIVMGKKRHRFVTKL